jgi:hypothetical protein
VKDPVTAVNGTNSKKFNHKKTKHLKIFWNIYAQPTIHLKRRSPCVQKTYVNNWYLALKVKVPNFNRSNKGTKEQSVMVLVNVLVIAATSPTLQSCG